MELRHTHRIFVPDDLAQGSVVAASVEQAHHLIHVLRLKGSDVLRLFNERHGEFRGTIGAVTKRGVEICVHEQIRAQTTEPDLWLCCAPIKKTHFDNMVEKSVELGVSEIQPILTQRTQIREVNADRVYKICREAAEQSDRLSVPAVGLPVSLADLVDVFPKDRALIVCAEWGVATPIYEMLNNPAMGAFTKAAIVTGPEGGFAGEELEKLRQVTNAFPVRLGPRILRADTAAIAALTCWQAVRGDWIK